MNPETQPAISTICGFLGCSNDLDSVKEALFKKPSRNQHPGAFPFDEETGKIYDTLWKAADAEHYTTAGKVGRWLMKLICPPADDEGMAAFHKKAAPSGDDRYENYAQQQQENASNNAYNDVSYSNKTNADVDEEEIHPQQQIEIENDNEETVIVVQAAPKAKKEEVVKRSHKKGD